MNLLALKAFVGSFAEPDLIIHWAREHVMKYKGFLLATASGGALAPAANAADLPAKAPAFAPPPPILWTGWYVGINAGAAWQQVSATNSEYSTSITDNRTTFIGGGQLGY